MTGTPPIDFTDAALQKCPFDAYDSIRQMGPVYREPSTGYYIVTSYDLVKKIAADPVRFANRTGILGVVEGARGAAVNKVYAEEGIPMVDVLVSEDAPGHTFHRALIEKVFTMPRVRQMEPYLQEVVDEYVNAVVDLGSADFTAKIATMIPIAIIADQLGVPRTDIPEFKRWSDASVAKNNPALSIEETVALVKTRCELLRYLADKSEEFRVSPKNCLLSDLVHAEVDGRRLTREEIVSMGAILVVAGNETTTNAISNCLVRLLDEPELQERLRNDPKQIINFVEEELRMEAPIQGLFRRATTDVELDGVKIPEGAILILKWGAANRDPSMFGCPNDYDMDRENKRQHLTFGYGIHYCVGNHLARKEIIYTIATILKRMKNLRLSARPDACVRSGDYLTYGLKSLYIDFDRI